MLKRGRDKRVALVAAYTGVENFVRKRQKMGGAVVIGVFGIVHVAVVVSVVGFVRGVCVRKREPGGRRSAADVGSPLEGRREVMGAVMECANGLVRVEAFGVG